MNLEAARQLNDDLGYCRASLTGDEFCIVKECSGNELSDE